MAEVERLLAAQSAERDARRKLRQQAVASRDSGRPLVAKTPSAEPAALQAEAAAQASRIAELERTIESQDDAVEKLQEALAQKAQRIVDLEEVLEVYKTAATATPAATTAAPSTAKATSAKPAAARETLRCSVCSAEKAANTFSSSQLKKKGNRVCQPCVLAESKPVLQ